ncbi:MAG: tRNA (adenosine(37)-N6)-threonylcarbamoyltransferase complex transferase subunit TsaD [Myxococcota bacterium]|jgi:N6-L-threonylcarbamoyladenine synthase|nr:tRNA (adenosine(37)-N6)-threonylcarbamoyltransferase complex transferase subunit TsaD [Myxococcota bacterium]
MNVLGIETSCDETAVAVLGPEGLASDVIHTQEIHRRYGGVVPELASRAHVEQVVATTRAALDRAGLQRPDGVAATVGPGLVGAVLVGACFGRALAAGWGVPFIGVNHLEGHLLSPLLESERPEFPFLALVVSGGHTTLSLAQGVGEYEVLGQTVDDAAGEAFDKVARMLGLPYPGGPEIDRLARSGDPSAVALPRPSPGGLDMSFSGLKTAVRNYISPPQGRPEVRPGSVSDADIAASFQAAVVDVLCSRVHKAAERTGVVQVTASGGVAANQGLRDRLDSLPLEVFLPPRARCTDNAGMIALVGRLRLLQGQRDDLGLSVRARWPLDSMRRPTEIP